MHHVHRLIVGAFLFLICTFLSAFDFGGSLLNESGITLAGGPDPDNPIYGANYQFPATLGQYDTLGLWTDIGLGSHSSISIRGNVKFSLDTPDGQKESATAFTPDVDSLVFYLGEPDLFGPRTEFQLWLGRTVFRDFTGLILDQKLDGLALALDIPRFSWKLGAATTAGLFKWGNTIIMDGKDSGDLSDSDVVFAPPRLVVLTELDFQRLLGEQNLTVGFLGQFDLRPNLAQAGTPVGSGAFPINTFYTGLQLDGKIAGPFFWKSFGVMEVGGTMQPEGGLVSPTSILSLLAGLRFSIFFPKVANSVIELGAKYGMGDQDAAAFYDANTKGYLSVFSTLSPQTAALIFNPQLGNVLQADASFSSRPFSGFAGSIMNEFQTVFHLFTFTRTSLGPISETTVAGSSDYFLGMECDLSFNWRPLSDLGALLGFGAFLPNKNILGEAPRFKILLQLNTSI